MSVITREGRSQPRPPWRAGLGWLRPAGAAGWALVVLLALALVLRIMAALSWWPTTILEDGYQTAAASNPFKDPKHPAGYALVLAVLGHKIIVPLALQHLSGFASALMLWAAVRRLTGSAWAGLLPAAIVLLDADQIFLEHSLMSESWVVLATAGALYAGVRTMQEPRREAWWAAGAGAALAAGVMLRSANLPLVAVALLVLLAAGWRDGWRRRWRTFGVAAAVAGVLLIGFAGANAVFGSRLGLAPAPGWYLYGRAAQFADCRRFTPPPGTAGLCEKRPVSQRPSGYWYMFIPQAPAPRLFGSFGSQDALVGGWARRAVRAQPGAFLTTAWSYLRSYYVPASLPARLAPLTTELDPQLDFSYRGNVFYDAAIQQAIESYYGPVATHQWKAGQSILRDWQVVVRFGATALSIATALTLVGLLVTRRRIRLGVVLFGLGGLSLLIAPVLTGTYAGRYTVPMAGPLGAAAALTLEELWRRWRSRADRRADLARAGRRPRSPQSAQ